MTHDATMFDLFDPPEQAEDLGQLGPYRVLAALGEGGMGKVFRAEDRRLKRTVALKVMNKKFASTANSRRRFIEEARSMAAVHHDNVATIYEVGERTGTPYIAMELLRGETLQDVNARGIHYSTERVMRIAREVARGLGAAHEVGIVHRDIKPANLWIEQPSGRVKILDFGLAVGGAGLDRLSVSGSVVGTPAYLTPEQARNDPVDERTDLYSLGVVLYELCAGQLPLKSKAVIGQLIAILAHKPQPIAAVNRDVPGPLAELIDRLLAKELADRPASANEFERLLDEVAARCQADSRRVVEIVTEPTPTPQRRTERVRKSEHDAATTPRRAMPTALVVGALAATILLVAGGAWFVAGMANGAPTVGSSTTGGRENSQPAKKQPGVLPEHLRPLELSRAIAETDRVRQGEATTFRLTLANTAVDAANDPKTIHRGLRDVARLVAFVRRPGEMKRNIPNVPTRILSATELPVAGGEVNVDLPFRTGGLPLDAYDVVFELQSPYGFVVDTATVPLAVVENLRVGELFGFEYLRTSRGIGADTYIQKGAGKRDFGTRKVVRLHRFKQQPESHGYLRFDLEAADLPAAEIDRAVLLMTLNPASFDGQSKINAYGVPAESTHDWSELADGTLNWQDTPSGKELSGVEFLGSVNVDNTKGQLERKKDAIRISGRALEDYLRSCSGGPATIVLVRENWQAEPTVIFAKESSPDFAPALAIRGRQGDEESP